MQVELILPSTTHSCCTLQVISGLLFLWLTRMLTRTHTHRVRGPVPLLWRCRRIRSEHCVGKVHSQEFCMFSFIGFLKSSPHSSHCTADVVDPTHSPVCFGFKRSFPKRKNCVLMCFMSV